MLKRSFLSLGLLLALLCAPLAAFSWHRLADQLCPHHVVLYFLAFHAMPHSGS